MFPPRHLSALALALLLGPGFSARAVEIEGVTTSAPERTGLKGDARTAVPAVAAADDSAEKARSKFRIPPGFATDLWAAEPLLSNPVAFCLDGQGRVFTSETNRYRTSTLDIRHYMFMLEDDLANRNQADWTASIKRNFPDEWQKLNIETEVVRLVEDSDGDGKADRSRVYADGFNTLLDGIASGVLAHDGSVWFTNIPSLWRLDGIGPDGRAQKKEALHTGYGVRFSYTGHDFHGLILAPDGRLYFSIGDRGAHVKTKEGKKIALPDEGGVFRCEPDGSGLELFMRGLRNPQELAFDDYGNLFTGDNDSDQGDRERWVLVCEGADAGWRIGWQHNPLGKERNPWLAEKMWEPRGPATPLHILSPIANLPDGPSGFAHYPGTGLPEKFEGNFFLCSFKGSSARSVIVTYKNKPKGAGYELVEQTNFIDSVQATDVDFGPDSKIYFSEWGEGWERNNRGRIFRIFHPEAEKAQARQIAEVKKLLGEGFKQRPAAELAKLLAHHDQRVRLRAQWALAEKPEAAALLAEAASRGQGLARLHGIWGLGHFARVKKQPAALQPLVALLGDGDGEVRANAARVLGEGRAKEASGALVKLLKDENLRARYFAAEALGKLGDALAAEPLLTMARENADQDQYLRHAAAVALSRLNVEPALAKAAQDSDKALRTVALLALYRMESGLVAQFLADKDPLLVKEAARIINDAPLRAAQPALAKLIASGSQDDQLMMRVLNANLRGGQASNALALAAYAAAEGNPEPLRVDALTFLAEWAKPAARDHVAGVFRPLEPRAPAPAATALKPVLGQLLASASPAVGAAAIQAAVSLDLRSEAPALAQLVRKAEAPVKLRVAALKALAAFDAPSLREAVQTALTDKNSALRVEAMGLLGKLDPNEAGTQLSAAYAASEPAEKKVILSALATLQSPAAAKTIAGLLANFTDQPREVQLELLEAGQKRSEPEVKQALQKSQGTIRKDDPVAPFTVAMYGGDRAAGEKLFKEHAVAACLRCHKLGGQGGDAGPDLSAIGKHDRQYILESIIVPGAKIAEGFAMVVITRKDGKIDAGFLKSETADALTVQAPGAPAVVIPKAEVQARDNAPSGMLPNYGELLTKREIRDIVEYCASLTLGEKPGGKIAETAAEKAKRLKKAHVVPPP